MFSYNDIPCKLNNKDYLTVIYGFLTDEMRVTNIAKRHPPFNHWEPIYIGTNEDPLYDERLSWEGRADKMTQVSFKHSSDRYV